MKKLTRYLKSRTVLVSVLVAMFGTLEMLLPTLGVYLPPWASGVATILTAGIMAFLRAITSQPLSERVGHDPVA